MNSQGFGKDSSTTHINADKFDWYSIIDLSEEPDKRHTAEHNTILILARRIVALERERDDFERRLEALERKTLST